MTSIKLRLILTVLGILFYVTTSTGDIIGTYTIAIDANQIMSLYNPLILGNNINWVYNGDGIFDPLTMKVKDNAALEIKNLGTTMLRFPGGNLAEYYNWKKGIGPISERGMGLDYERKPQKMNFGLDDFLRYCDKSGIIPVITVGYTNNTPASAAEMVEYCNGPISSPMGSLRAGNGHPAPYKVKYWEIGNEIYHKGITSELASAYGKKTAEIAVAMKKVDHAILIGAIGLGVSKIWDESVLKECAHNIDFLIYHRYFPNTSSNDASETNDAVIAATVKMLREINRLHDTASNINPKLAVAVTEYNLDFRDAKKNFINKPSDIQQALFIAECIRLFQLNNVLFATKWDLAHVNKHFMSDINFHNSTMPTLAPSYYAQQIYSKADIDTIVKTQTSSPTINVNSFGEIKNEKNAPILTSIAGIDKNGSTLSVIVINRDLNNSYKIKISINNIETIKSVLMTTMKEPLTGAPDHFIINTIALAPNSIGNLIIPAGSISLFKISF